MSLLQYYLIAEVPGQYRQYMDSTGRPWLLNYSARFTTYMPPELITDYEVNVSRWRVEDQNHWYDVVVKPVIEAFWNNTVGIAFQDAQKAYDSPTPIPRYAQAGQVFRIGEWVFVPDGAIDPRHGGVSQVINEAPPEPAPIDFEEDLDSGLEDAAAAAPSAMSYGVRGVLAAAIGGLAAYIAYAVASEFLD